EQHYDAADDQREQHREQRHDHQLAEVEAAHDRLSQQVFRDRPCAPVFAHAAAPWPPAPAMASPISPMLARPPSNAPAIRPRYMTRIRSESARISSSSVERISTPTPASRT